MLLTRKVHARLQPRSQLQVFIMKFEQFDTQQLLGDQAALSNQLYDVKQEIRRRLENQPKPPCFGDDDCSTETLSRCPWRIDCGT